MRGRGMEILIAAVVLSVGLVAAAALLGPRRTAHGTAPPAAPAPAPAARSEGAAAPAPPPRADPAQAAALTSREAKLAEREAALEREREQLAPRRDELIRTLERVSGLTSAQAKAILLK